MSQLLEDDVLACLLMSLAKAMGPEMVSLWREQRVWDSGEQQRRAWSLLQRRATSAIMEHAAMAGYTGARCVMKADFGCGILL